MKLFPSLRLRRTPFTGLLEQAGVTGFTIYNHMLLPAVVESLEEDYRHLKRAVQLWDVSCERQVQITGPDRHRLAQYLTARDLSKLTADRCLYAPITDARGGMLNDPVMLAPDPERIWISIADSDLLYWVLGVAAAGGFDVEVSEPDVSPLAVQGPLAGELVARVFGDGVRDLRFFRHGRFEFEGHSLTISRSGYSKQGGFEIYVTPGEIGPRLWAALMAAGEDLEVRAGCPNLIERIEGGMLSYGGDMTREHTPHECGLGRYCDAPEGVEHIGRAALAGAGTPRRRIMPVEVPGARLPPIAAPWPVMAGDRRVGQVTAAAWSPDHGVNVAIGMLDAGCAAGETVALHHAGGVAEARLRDKFWN